MAKFIEITVFGRENAYINTDHILLIMPIIIKGIKEYGVVIRESQTGTKIIMTHPFEIISSKTKETACYEIMTTMSYESIRSLIDN